MKGCYCPICNSEIEQFDPFGMKSNHPPRPNAKCPICGSLERHRLIWLYLKERTNLFGDHLKMLHVSPEPQVGKLLRSIPNIEYISADLNPKLAMMQMDITQIALPDNTFDVIYASHVLEHIPDDVKAMKELYRICKPSGWAILQVPIWGNKTLEDPSIVSPEDREKVFGQSDHVRLYGHDGVYKARLQLAGWNVKVDSYVKTMDATLVKKYGLMANEDIYYCSK
jgi:SAM-dependent methyltransferase